MGTCNFKKILKASLEFTETKRLPDVKPYFIHTFRRLSRRNEIQALPGEGPTL